MKLIIAAMLGSFIFICSAFGLEEVTQSFTLDGRLYADALATTPLLDVVQMKLQILNSTQTCILYEETQTVDTTLSNGFYTLHVGQKRAGIKRSAGDSDNYFSTIFSNTATALPGRLVANGAACSYTPLADDSRYMKVTMVPSDGIARTTTTNMMMDAVPMSLVAERAETLQGLGPSSFVKTTDLGTGANQVVQMTAGSKLPAIDGSLLTALNPSNLSAAVPIAKGGTGQTSQTAGFDALAPNTSKGDLIVHNGTNNVRVPVGTNNFVLTADSSQASGVKWAAASGATGDASYGAKGLIQFLTDAATSGITVSSGVANVNTGTGANQIVKLDGASKLPAVDGSALTNLNAGNIATGTLPIARGGTNSGTALTNGKVMVSSAGAIVEGVASNTAKSNNTFVMRDGSGNIAGALGTFDQLALNGSVSGTIQVAVPSTTANYTFTLPNSAGTNGYVLQTNGSGATSWVAQTSGVNGSGTTGKIPKFTASGTLGDSIMTETATGIGVGVASPNSLLEVSKDQNSVTSVTATNVNAGTGAYVSFVARNDITTGVAEFGVGGTGNTLAGNLIQDRAYISSGANLQGLVVSTENGKPVIFAPDLTERARFDGLGNLGIGNTSPGALLDIGKAGTTLGTMRLEGNTSGYVQIQPAAAAGSWTMTLPPNAGSNGYLLSTNGSGVTSWVAAGGTGTVTNITAGTGLNVGAGPNGSITTTGTLNIDVGTGANQIVQLTAASKYPAVDGSLITSLNPANLSAAVPIVNGGTGQTAKTAAFDALAPNTTKGDLIVHNGTNNIRLPAGTDTYVLTADSAQPSGVKWAAASGGTSSDATYSAKGIVQILTDAATSGLTIASGVLNVNFGTGANQIVKLDASSKLPAVDGSALTNLNAGSISSGTLPITRGGTGATSMTANALVMSNGTGTAYTPLVCGTGEYVTFTAGGVAACGNATVGSGFVNGGNTFAANATLGTNDAFALNFETNNTTKMTILSGGNVGIGTTNPWAVLDVQQADLDPVIRVLNTNSTVARKPTVAVQNYMGTANIGYPRVELQNNRGNASSPVPVAASDLLGVISFTGASDTSYNAQTGSQIIASAAQGFSGTAAGSDLSFLTTPLNSTSPVERLRIKENGNVGIGTSSPTSHLHVYGSGFQQIVSESSDSDARIVLKRGGLTKASWFEYNTAGRSDAWLIGQNYTGDNTGFQFNYFDGTSSITPLAVTTGGKVGIGTQTPRAALDVTGSIVGTPSLVNTTATIDFANGNIQHTANNCGAFALHNLKDGGSYMFIVKGTTSATCSFTAFSNAGTTGLTVHLPPNHAATTVGTHTIYNLAVSGGDVYFSWIPGY